MFLLFFLSRKAQIFFPEFNISYMTKTLNQIIFIFLHQNQNIFFSNIGNQNIFFRKKTYPPFKLYGRSLITHSLYYTKVMSLIRAHGEVYSVQHDVIKLTVTRESSMILCGTRQFHSNKEKSEKPKLNLISTKIDIMFFPIIHDIGLKKEIF